MPRKIKSFPIHRFMAVLTEARRSWNAPVVTLIAKNRATPFEVLISTLLSLRTKDEVTAAASKRLFKKANTAASMLALGETAVRELIFPVGFYPTKAGRIMEICRILLDKYGGRVPDTMDDLLALPGVGRKSANLVLVEGFAIPAICVDTHVHRISNRIGYIETKDPFRTEMALRKKLPKKYRPVQTAFRSARSPCLPGGVQGLLARRSQPAGKPCTPNT